MKNLDRPKPNHPVDTAVHQRRRWASHVAIAVLVMGHVAGETRAKEKKSAEDNRGIYFNLAMSASELDGPSPTSSTDLGLFRGLGLAPAVGYRWGPFRTELEWQPHHSESMFHGDTLGMNALLVNLLWDFFPARRLGVSVGAGAGYARLTIDFSTCLEPGGCGPWAVTDASAGAIAYHYIIGLDWETASGGKVFGNYRRLYTDDLGLRYSLGRCFDNGGLHMPMYVMGYQWRY